MYSHDGHEAAADHREPSLQRPAQRPRRGGAHEHHEIYTGSHARSHDPGEHYQEETYIFA